MKAKPKNLNCSPAKVQQLIEERDWANEQFQKIKKRCHELERATEGSAREVRLTRERYADDALAAMLVKQRLDTLLAWAALKRPDLLRLERKVMKHTAEAKAGVSQPVVLNVTAKKRSPMIFDTSVRQVKYG